MKQTLTLAVLGSIYGLAALIDAPIVFRQPYFCWAGTGVYAGPGWFAASAGAFAIAMLCAAFWRAVSLARVTPALERGIESIAYVAPRGGQFVFVESTAAYPGFTADFGAGVPPIDFGPG